MTRSLFLQDFSRPAPAAVSAPSVSPVDGPAEDALEAFDRGYKSGWADCIEAGSEEKRGIGAALAQAISDAALTEAAARRDIISALGPFFDDVVATLLPRLATAAVGPTVLAELTALAELQLNAEIEIRCAPSACAGVEGLVEDQGMANVTVKPEPTFGDGQVSLRLGHERRDIDMAGTAERIADAITAFRSEISDNLSQTNKGVV